MHNPLNKRFKRDLKSDAGKYIAIFLFIIFFVGAASGFLVADNSVLATFDNNETEYNLEDGHISFNIQPDDQMLEKIESQNDLKLFELNYKEENINNTETILRIYKNREEVDKVCLMSGEMPSTSDEVAIDRAFADNNDIKVGDDILIKDENYKVTGFVALSDYSSLFKSDADMMFDAVGFGVAIMTDGGYDSISNAHETINYAWKYNNPVDDTDTENAKSELLIKSLENIIKEYDEPIVQEQVDSLYDVAKPYINRLKNEFTTAENKLESKYLSAIRNGGIGNEEKIASELGITVEQYRNLKNVLDDAEKNQDNYDFDFDSAPKVNLDDYKTSSTNEFNDALDEIYKIVDAISDANLYDCTQIYKDLASVKNLVDDFDINDSGIITIKNYSAKYTNKSIVYAQEDGGSDKASVMLMIYIIMVVIAFLFAVTTSNTITKEANVIGTLRAMGYSKGQLIKHYMFLPVTVTVIGSILGNILGYTVFQNAFVGVYYANYSLTEYKTLWNMDAFLETTVIPFILILLINFIVLSKKLKISPLNFIRGELKKSGQKKLIKLPKKLPFFSKFRLRILFQNVPLYLTMFFGIFLAGVLVVFGSMFGPLLNDYSDIVKQDQISKYQYIMINEAETVNEDAEKFCLTSLKTTDDKFMADEVSVYGIANQSKFITTNIPSGEVLLSSAMADKFGLSKGDKVTLKEAYKDKTYTFTVAGSYKYDAAITVFMNRTDYLNTFNEDSDYFTGYFSNEELTDLNSDDVATVVTEKDLTKIVTQMQVSMSEFVKVFNALGVLIFLLIMFILTKQIIERNSKSISMTKILGFSDSEIGKLYLVITSFVVVLSLFVSVPLISLVLRWGFKSYLYTQMTGYIPYIISNSCYVTMIVLGIVSYIVVAFIMLKKIKKTPLGEALKNQSL